MPASKIPPPLNMADGDTTARPGSPSPLTSPTLALHSVPPLDRSVSTASSVSSVSGKSEGGTPLPRRRGYMRPQATTFAASAKNRDSVMSLGTIAHLQYYFARTGLLDGKGGQLAKGKRKSGAQSGSSVPGTTADRSFSDSLASPPLSRPGSAFLSDLSTSPDGESAIYAASESGLVESPVDEYAPDNEWDSHEPMMLPPTVSTYKHRPDYVPPPPDMAVLRRELREALDDAQKVMEKAKAVEQSVASAGGQDGEETPTLAESQGFYEIQGLNLLDLVTLAIRAARNYSTAHEQPLQLYAIKSERRLRTELYHVLDVLKRMAARNFAGGVRRAEHEEITGWIMGVNGVLDVEEEMEKEEQAQRESWTWRDGDWTGREREREWLFLRSFDSESEPLPTWTAPSTSDDGEELPTPFLKELQTGVRLVKLHNELVRKSRRPFEEIKVFHTDTAKPYRCAENLRFWIKAAELRWETKLEVDVMGVVQNTHPTAWRGFDEALLAWCGAVRQEIAREWVEHTRRAAMAKTPTFRIEEGVLDDELEISF